MKSLWLNNGKIVTDSGSAVLCDECPCDPPPPPPSESGSGSSGSTSSSGSSGSTSSGGPGSGETVETDCCEASLPASLPVTLTGDIAATLTATYVGFNTWETGVFSYDGFDWVVSLQCSSAVDPDDPPSMYVGIKCEASQEVGSTSELFDCSDIDISGLIEYTFGSCGGFRSVTVAIGG